MDEAFDLIVVGGGRAFNLAVAAGQAGWKVALVERDRLGGTCPNRGCVPSKLLIGFAHASRAVREAARHFVDAEWRGVDLQRVFASVNDCVDGVDDRYAARLPAGVEVIRAHGRFVADHVVEAAGRRLTAQRIVVATGTRPVPPPFPGAWTSDDLFPLRGPVPASITVVGGGYIACELANFFAAVGVRTRQLVRGQTLLDREDPQVAQVFREQYVRHVPVDFGTEVIAADRVGGTWQMTLRRADGTQEPHRSEALLFAIGRRPNTDQLGLERTGIQLDRRGNIVTDDRLRATVEGVYAAGDIAGRHVLQHVASYDVHYLRRRLLKGEDAPLDYGAVPHAVFSDPEVAGVGATEPELEAAGIPYVAVWQDWLASAKAMSTLLEYPRVKLLVSPADYRILGAHLVGPEAATLLHQVLAVMRAKNDVRELAEMMYVHPALPEFFLAAGVEAVKRVHAARRE